MAGIPGNSPPYSARTVSGTVTWTGSDGAGETLSVSGGSAGEITGGACSPSASEGIASAAE